MRIRRKPLKKRRAELLDNSDNKAIVMTAEGWKYPGLSKLVPFGHAKYVTKTEEGNYAYKARNL